MAVDRHDDGTVSRHPLPDREPSASAGWSTPEFLAEARAFAEAALGPVTLHQHKLRGWSTVLTARCAEGLFWVKQGCPSQAFEAALLDELGRLVPDRVVPLRAVDRDRGLLLMPDQGPVHDSMTTDLDLWCEVVRQWARLQRVVAPYVDRLGVSGVATLLPQDCPALLDERSAALNELGEDDPRRLGDENFAAIRRHRASLTEAVEVVGALGLPVTLNHNDLHGGNVFTSSGPVLRFFDFGDAMLTEPMAALLTPLNLLRRALDCAPDDPRLWRVAQAWVEVWSDLAPSRELRRVLPHALLLARLPRHECWLRVTSSMSPSELAEWGSAPAEVLAATTRTPLLGARTA